MSTAALILALVPLVIAAPRTSGLREHWDPAWDLTFRYPGDWSLYTPSHPGPIGYFRSNQVAMGAAPGREDVSFNVGVIIGVPPQPFAERMEATFAAMARQSRATRTSFREVTVASLPAVELRQRLSVNGVALTQRIVAVAGPANGFMLTCTAPDALFDEADRGAFEIVVESFVIGEPGTLAFWRSLWKQWPPLVRTAVIVVAVLAGGGLAIHVLRPRPYERTGGSAS